MENLSADLTAKLVHQVRKYLNKCNGKPTTVVLENLQISAIHFFGAITASNSEAHEDVGKQLDYIESVRKDLNHTLDILMDKIRNSYN